MANISAITKTKFFKLLFNGFIFSFSVIYSYPLYTLYLCFFTSYIIKISYFIYPLFITTSLALVSLVTASFSSTESSLLYAYDVSQIILQCKIDDEGEAEGEFFRSLEARVMYAIVFDTSDHVYVSEEYPEGKIYPAVESSVLEISQNYEQDCSVKTEEALKADTILEQDPSIGDSRLASIKPVLKQFEDFLKKEEESEIRDCNEEIKKTQTEINQSLDEQDTEQSIKVVHYGNSISRSTNIQSRRHSTRTNINYTPRSDLGRYGSMRKGREWTSTIVCKLLEEKHNSSNIEGNESMDLLWEKFDEWEITNGNTKKGTKKIDSSGSKNGKHAHGEDEEEEDDFGGYFCCSPAFQLSATKMKSRVGRRNLAKNYKPIKGVGWMYRESRHMAKVHNNNGETVQFA